MTRKPAGSAVPLIVIGFLPVALFGLVPSVNEYRDQGIAGAVDCNGPLTVMLFAAPSLVVYAGGAVYYAARLMGGRRGLLSVALMALCLVMVAAAGGKAWAAYGEKSTPEHRESCGTAGERRRQPGSTWPRPGAGIPPPADRAAAAGFSAIPSGGGRAAGSDRAVRGGLTAREENG